MHENDAAFRAKYGPWALVAGGSLGLGAEFARQLAARGLDLVLVADDPESLERRAEAIRRDCGREVRTLELDLADRDMSERLRAVTRELEIGLLVYNAAYSSVGAFLDHDVADKLRAIDVNCRGPLLLADAYARPMAARGRGGVVLMSSLSAFQGCARVATYAATKAFNLVLGESLWEELREHGVDVLAFCPGATRTPGYEASKPRRLRRAGPPVMEVEPVVAEALAALGRGPSAIAGRSNRLAAWVMHRALSRRAAVAVMGRSMRALYPG
jgi:short-subunit dehydrogenase